MVISVGERSGAPEDAMTRTAILGCSDLKANDQAVHCTSSPGK